MAKKADLTNRAYQASRSKNHSEATNFYIELIKIDPKNHIAYTNLIEALIIIGDFDRANQYLEEVRKHKLSVQNESIVSMLNTVFALSGGEEVKTELDEFKETLKGGVSLTWRFDELEEWLVSPEFKLGDEIKSKIQDVIDRFKVRQAELKDK